MALVGRLLEGKRDPGLPSGHCYGAFKNIAYSLSWEDGLIEQACRQHPDWCSAGISESEFSDFAKAFGGLTHRETHAERLPARLAGVTPKRMLKLLARGVACFFLVMAVLDPLLQISVQHLGWSSGLLIEVGFFVPAGHDLSRWRLRAWQGVYSGCRMRHGRRWSPICLTASRENRAWTIGLSFPASCMC